MALSPLVNQSNRAITITKVVAPSKTYSIFGPDDYEIGGMIDGRDAIIQFIRKTIATPRYRHLIYNSAYGSEIESLVGQDVPAQLLQTEIPRLIREALIYDDRIDDVKDFVVTRNNDGLYVSFTVDTVFGSFNEGVTI